MCGFSCVDKALPDKAERTVPKVAGTETVQCIVMIVLPRGSRRGARSPVRRDADLQQVF